MRGTEETVRAAVLTGPRDLEIRDVSTPEYGPGDLLVKVRAVGICGSDIHMFFQGRIGTSVVESPQIMGHEFSGEVVAIGEDVREFSVGQRVVVEPGFACGHCENCRAGHYNLCPNVRFIGVPPYPGGMAEYVAVPQQWAYHLPDNLSLEEGALVEPLVVAVEAVEKAGITLDSDVAIFGAGPIGLMALQVVRAKGARQVMVVDVIERRLDLARKLGATVAIDGATADVASEIRQLTHGGANVAIELSGAPPAITQLFRSTRKGAKVVLAGIAEPRTVELEYTNIVRSGLHIETVFRYVNHFPMAIDLISRGLVDVTQLVSHRLPLEKAAEAFALIEERRSEVVKIVLTIS